MLLWWTGPAIVEDAFSKTEECPSPEDTASRPPATSSPSLSEAEEQAVRILESAIASAGDIASSKSSQEDDAGIEDVTLTGTSVILTPDQEAEEMEKIKKDEVADTVAKEKGEIKCFSLIVLLLVGRVRSSCLLTQLICLSVCT